MINPKPYHIELRKDTSFQEILLEDDIHAFTETEAVNYCKIWKMEYINSFRPEYNIIAVCTHNWTEETLHQDVPEV